MNDNYHHQNKNEESKSNPNYKLPSCYFHPKEILIGVCPRCLNEKLVTLAAAAAASAATSNRSTSKKNRRVTTADKTITSTTFLKPKVFAFGSLFNLLELGCRKPEDVSGDDEEEDRYTSATSLDDSFISIKFEENGLVSWDNSRTSEVPQDHCNVSNWTTQTSTKGANTNKCVVEHTKTHGSLRWHKRIGKLFRLIRCKRTNSTRHVESKVEATTRVVKLRSKGWIRGLKRHSRAKI